MAADQRVQVRVDRTVKEEAAAVLADMGLTVSDAVRIFLTRVARDKTLPFSPLRPNTLTIQAIKEAREGALPQFGSAEDLLENLRADD